jgi:putative DNA primase/helicase
MTVDTSKIREEAEGIKRREKYLTKHLLSSQNAARFNSIKTLAQQQPGVIALPEQFDRQRELLNCRNGTIDLNRHAFVPHDRELLLSKSTGIAYAKGADCPLWNAFLSRIMGGKAHLVEYLQRITGYILTGLIFEQIVIILYGIGANGKSTFVNMLLRLMGDYGMQASIETFIERKNPGTPNDIARMKGARLVAVSESAKGAALNEGFVKQATGGEPLQARFLYGEFFQYAPEFKILLVTNHKPHIRGTDNGIWRRIRLIPFEETIPESEQDRRLEEKLAKELPGILNWALEGCRMWQQIGEAPPVEVKAAVEQYRRDMDLLGEFLQECCALSPRAEVPFKDLYARYLAWCEKEGEKKPVSKKGFSRSLVERGMRSIKKSGGIHYLRGIALLSCADCADCADFLVNSQAEKSDVVSWEEFQEKRRDRHNHHEKSTESIAAQEIPDRADSEDDREVFII